MKLKLSLTDIFGNHLVDWHLDGHATPPSIVTWDDSRRYFIPTGKINKSSESVSEVIYQEVEPPVTIGRLPRAPLSKRKAKRIITAIDGEDE